MDFRRVWHSFRLCTIFSGFKRADYLRKHHIFASMGEGCCYQGRKIPLYPNLISFGDHVRLTGSITFLTHDTIHTVLNKWSGKNELYENAGCIKIGNNVFISSGVIILSNVNIGDNVIIAAGSVVENDIPSNCVVEGAPAKVKCKIDVLYAIRKMRAPYPKELKLRDNGYATPEAAEYLWKMFEKTHTKK